jgi:hypothetical protein
MKYRDLYDALADMSIFGRLVDSGWFPFVEILGAEFGRLVEHCEAGFALNEIEGDLLARFPATRIESMFTRWMEKPHFAGKQRLLRSAINSFAVGDSDVSPGNWIAWS